MSKLQISDRVIVFDNYTNNLTSLKINGYQPEKPTTEPTDGPKPQGGPVPTGTGDNPANEPAPPGNE